MSRKKLEQQEIEDIVERYENGENTMQDLSEVYGVHRKTIARILENHGVYSKAKESRLKDEAYLQVIKKYGVDSPQTLEKIFLTPALTLPNVLAFLKEATESELAYLFYEAATHKVKASIDSKESKEEEVEDAHNA